MYEVPLKLTAYVWVMSLPPKYFVGSSKEELKTENCLSTFFVNTEILMSSIKLPFYK